MAYKVSATKEKLMETVIMPIPTQPEAIIINAREYQPINSGDVSLGYYIDTMSYDDKSKTYRFEMNIPDMNILFYTDDCFELFGNKCVITDVCLIIGSYRCEITAKRL